MYKKRQGPKDLLKIQEEIKDARTQLELLNIDAVRVQLNNMENVIITSIEREKEINRKGE